MAVTLPKIEVTFKQLAASFVRRSERGITVLILRDATEGSGESFFRFGDATQVPENEFTAANQQYIKDALSFGPLRVSVVKVGAEGTLAQALAILVQKEQTGWITVCDGPSSDWTDLVSWIKAREKEEKSWKAVCYDTTSPDCMHVVNFVNKTVTFADDRGAVGGGKYTPSLAGLLGGAAAQWVFDTLFRPGLVERIGESLASLGSGDTYTAVQGVFASLPDFILVFVIIAEVILHQRHEQVIGNLHILHSLPFLSATAATIATVVWAAAFSPLQPSQPSRGLFAFSIIGQRDAPPLVPNLVLIADVVFIQKSTGLHIQILAQRVCCHAGMDSIGKLGWRACPDWMFCG